MSYLSTLQQKGGDRLEIAFGIRGCNNLWDLFNKFPDDAVQLARGLAGLQGSISRRQRRPFQVWPMPLLLANDPEISVEEYTQIVRNFLNHTPLELPPGPARLLRNSMEHYNEAEREEALIRRMKSTSRGADVINVTVAQVENMHAGHKRRSAANNQTGHMATAAALSIHAAYRARQTEFTRVRSGDSPVFINLVSLAPHPRPVANGVSDSV